VLDWRLVVERVGASSVGLRLDAHCDGEHRLTARLTLVWLGPDRRPARWPDRIRTVFAEHQEQS